MKQATKTGFIILFIAGAAGLGYWYYRKRKKQNASSSANQTPANTDGISSTGDIKGIAVGEPVGTSNHEVADVIADLPNAALAEDVITKTYASPPPPVVELPPAVVITPVLPSSFYTDEGDRYIKSGSSRNRYSASEVVLILKGVIPDKTGIDGSYGYKTKDKTLIRPVIWGDHNIEWAAGMINTILLQGPDFVKNPWFVLNDQAKSYLSPSEQALFLPIAFLKL